MNEKTVLRKNTKIQLGHPVARGLEHTPLLLDMAKVGNLLICADNEKVRTNILDQIIKGEFIPNFGEPITRCGLSRSEDRHLWYLGPNETTEFDSTWIVNDRNPANITDFLDEVAAEYEHRKAWGQSDAEPEPLLFVIIHDLQRVIDAIYMHDTYWMLNLFSLGKKKYPERGIFLIAGLDIDTLGLLNQQRFRLYDCQSQYTVMITCGEQTAKKRQTLVNFFGERMGDLIASEMPAKYTSWLIDFVNPPTPFVYQTPKKPADKHKDAE